MCADKQRVAVCAVGLTLLCLFAFGCRTRSYRASGIASSASLTNSAESTILEAGDQIEIDFGVDAPVTKETIPTDGQIVLPLGISLMAAGKTMGALEKEIRERYVPKY